MYLYYVCPSIVSSIQAKKFLTFCVKEFMWYSSQIGLHLNSDPEIVHTFKYLISYFKHPKTFLKRLKHISHLPVSLSLKP